MGKCLYCGKEFVNKHKYNQIYCNRECYLKSRKKIHPLCQYCGKEIQRSSNKPISDRKYCSTECYRKAKGCKEFKYVSCEFCGQIFKESRDRPNLFCSRDCASLFYKTKSLTEKEKNKEDLNRIHKQNLTNLYKEKLKELKEIQYKIDHEKICIVCGNEFQAKNTNMICCSEKCRKYYDNQRRDKRLQKNGKPDLSISLSKLYERDKGICKLCGKHIDFDCDPNSDRYPSIDHIIPICKGGLHQWNNIQLACRVCNTLKGGKA